jgi:nitrate reductase alpha subunit
MAKTAPTAAEKVKSVSRNGLGKRYRERWKWDKVVWGSHVVDCYPTVGSCPYRVYVKDGRVVFEEQAGVIPAVEKGVPDFNPMGCQKGRAGA